MRGVACALRGLRRLNFNLHSQPLLLLLQVLLQMLLLSRPLLQLQNQMLLPSRPLLLVMKSCPT